MLAAVLAETLMVLSVTHETQDRIFAAVDGGATLETRGIEDWKARYKDGDEAAFNGGAYFPPKLSAPPQLVMKNLGFTPDAFQVDAGGGMYVSKRLRDALGLDETSAQYIEIDDSLSDPEARLMGYAMVRFPFVDIAADEKKSSGRTWEEILGADVAAALNSKYAPPFDRVVLKPDFAPTRDVFSIARGGGYYVQESFAKRIAGFNDVSLYAAEKIVQP